MPTVTITASEDTFLVDATPTTNFGSATSGAIGNTRPVSTDIANRLYLRFPLVGVLDPSAIIDSAVLTLRKVSGGTISGATEFKVYYQLPENPAWVEGEASWDNYATGALWSLGGGDFQTDAFRTTTISDASEDLVFDITELQQEVLSFNPADNLELCVVGPEGNGSAAFQNVATSEAAAELRPTLEVTYWIPDATYIAPVNTTVPIVEFDADTPYDELVNGGIVVLGEGASARTLTTFSGLEIPPGYTLDRAVLFFALQDQNGEYTPASFTVQRLAESYVTAEVTWNSREDETPWTDAGGTVIGPTASVTPDTIQIGGFGDLHRKWPDITELYQDAVDNYGGELPLRLSTESQVFITVEEDETPYAPLIAASFLEIEVPPEEDSAQASPRAFFGARLVYKPPRRGPIGSWRSPLRSLN